MPTRQLLPKRHNVRDDLEVGVSLCWPIKSSELGVLKFKNDVIRGRTGPLSAVCWISPAWIRVVNEDDSLVLDISEFCVLELVYRYIVRAGWVAFDGMLFSTTLCESLEFVEIDVIEFDITTP